MVCLAKDILSAIITPMELTTENREILGKKVNSLRRQGLIPAEFYGHGFPNKHLVVKQADFNKVFKEAGENMVITLVSGKEKLPALIYDIDKDYLSGEVSHVDFYGVRMDEEIKAAVPIEFTGESPAVKDKGGVLNKSLNEIEVEALPANLPQSFTVDLSGLVDLDQSIYVKDITVPKNVKILVQPETVVISVTPPREEEVAPAVPVDVSEIKVETEEKKLEREQKKTSEEGQE